MVLVSCDHMFVRAEENQVRVGVCAGACVFMNLHVFVHSRGMQALTSC